jgi:hypothetical protein
LDKRADQVLPGREGDGVEKLGMGVRGRNGPNNVRTYELKKKNLICQLNAFHQLREQTPSLAS